VVPCRPQWCTRARRRARAGRRACASDQRACVRPRSPGQRNERRCALPPPSAAPGSRPRFPNRRALPLAGLLDPQKQLARFLSTPVRNASASGGRAEAEAGQDASAFMIPITMRAIPSNASSGQAAAAPSAAAAGRRLLQAACNPGDRLCVPIDNTYDVFCERPAPSFHDERTS